MADSAMQLLDINSRITADAFSRIDRASTERAQREEQARQFNEQIVQRGSEFAVEMAYKDRLLSAEIAANTLNAENQKFQNQMQFDKFQMEMELMPMRHEIQKIELESAKENQKRSIQQQKEGQFNNLTRPTDTRVAAELSRGLNADLGNAYLSIKSKYMGLVSQGNAFDEVGFQNEVNGLLENYKTAEVKSGYDPAVATMMDQMGATAEAARYRAKNPVFADALPGIKTTMLLGDERIWNSNIQQYGAMFKGEEITQLAATKSALNGLDNRIAQKQEEQKSMLSRINGIQDPVQKQKAIEESNRVDDEIDILRKQKDSLFNKAVGYSVSFEDVNPDPNKKDKDDLALKYSKSKEELAAGSSIAPAPKTVSAFEKNQEAAAAEANIGTYTVRFPEAMGNKISFKTWEGQNPRKHPDYAKSLRNEIITNISELPLDATEAEEGERTLDQLIQSEEFKKLFDELDRNPVKVENLYGGTNANTFIGKRTIPQWLGSTGFDSTAFVGIDSYDEAMEMIRNFEGTKDQKRIFIEKLYSSVLAAGAVNQFSRGK